MSYLILPPHYKSLLSVRDTEIAIKRVKDFFQDNLSSELRLRRVTAPLFVERGSGLNDDLNGVERAVRFPIKDMGDKEAEIVHSLAKWKRCMLADLNVPEGFGLYTDMNAIRADESLGNAHSLYVDQWDWEIHISEQKRNLTYLRALVEQIYNVMLRAEYRIAESYHHIKPCLPEKIYFIHSEDLRARYPDLTPKEREHAIVREHKAVFLIGVGAPLGDGKPHDGRAPDYDDWTSEAEGKAGLNGDILVWHPVLEDAFELSSMGIRVDKKALEHQLHITGQTARKELYFHQRLLRGELPLSVGGGIGQSRLCMFFLRKAHIGEIQVSIWPREMREQCAAHDITLL